ncbi:flagella basal body P-ring formation protein FlgA [Syntrophotalea acetylenivorans]|uniref:Flagella basal body P-ring formation protein FlgA n=1 Tax=Syntrophotalea acetylenivorans TaxID=1842532 RepID=A0A1L3GN70_9BACT|nr:flagellar basal body P-ring formation chaperone FlgA [Syntrophotalea acetylenivorans]APG27340.1 flagella basal body P-ring formation protein FlgA [Syntrophotalea acetylenivorans]
MNFALRLSAIICLSCLLSLPLIRVGHAAAVERQQQIVIKPEQVQKHLEDYLDQHRSKMPQVKLRFRHLRLPKAFSVPAGRLTCEINPSNPRVLSSSRFNLIFRVDGKAVKNLAVSATLEALAEVAVVAGDLQRGTIITEQHIELAERDLNRLRAPCFDSGELLGKRLKRSLRKGDVFERSAVAFPPMVKRGEIVTITAQKGALTVTAKGMAQQNGNAGDMIRVRNISSQKDLICKVAGPVAVTVEL